MSSWSAGSNVFRFSEKLVMQTFELREPRSYSTSNLLVNNGYLNLHLYLCFA